MRPYLISEDRPTNTGKAGQLAKKVMAACKELVIYSIET
jgi:hypothetical protein